jgi:hypothetical protein
MVAFSNNHVNIIMLPNFHHAMSALQIQYQQIIQSKAQNDFLSVILKLIIQSIRTFEAFSSKNLRGSQWKKKNRRYVSPLLIQNKMLK